MLVLCSPLYASVVASLVGNVVLPSLIAISLSSNVSEYDFGSGSSVQIENILKIQDKVLTEPKFIGAGGGGAVFSYRQSSAQPPQSQASHTNDNVVVKYSWLQSAQSVTNECNVLKVMEARHVTGVERCLARMDYQPDPRRTVIVMEPYLEDAVSSMAELSPDVARKATQNLIKSVVEMLAARVATVDLQPLISKRTGDLILIDMTEAVILGENTLSSIEKATVAEFCTEVVALIPDNLLDDASQFFTQETKRLEQSSGVLLQDDVGNILEGMLNTN